MKMKVMFVVKLVEIGHGPIRLSDADDGAVYAPTQNEV
jgi:hypothetical protein